MFSVTKSQQHQLWDGWVSGSIRSPSRISPKFSTPQQIIQPKNSPLPFFLMLVVFSTTTCIGENTLINKSMTASS